MLYRGSKWTMVTWNNNSGTEFIYVNWTLKYDNMKQCFKIQNIFVEDQQKIWVKFSSLDFNM